MPAGFQIRQIKYLNNIVEQAHRFIKKRTRSILRFQSYKMVNSILIGIEAMHMIKKGQISLLNQSIKNQNIFIN